MREKLYLKRSEVSDPTFWMEACGIAVSHGDEEWHLMDDESDPSSAYAFLSMAQAFRFAQDNNITVMIPRRKP